MTLSGSLLRNALILSLLAAFLASGCGRTRDDVNEGVPVEELYERGHKSMRGGNWSNAVNTYRRLVAQYPYGPHTEQALIEVAYAQYKMGSHDEAISNIDRFLRTYPTHRNTAYMYYLRGLVNASRDTVFLQRVWSLNPSSRDLSAPHQAYADFATVADRYANTRYAADARERMIALRDMFARHEVEAALYYLRRDAWVAAASRAIHVLETYPQSGFQNDAVAVLAEAHTRLGNEELANDARRVLEMNAPDHAWLQGNWPREPWAIRRANPFAGEKSALDRD